MNVVGPLHELRSQFQALWALIERADDCHSIAFFRQRFELSKSTNIGSAHEKPWNDQKDAAFGRGIDQSVLEGAVPSKRFQCYRDRWVRRGKGIDVGVEFGMLVLDLLAQLAEAVFEGAAPSLVTEYSRVDPVPFGRTSASMKRAPQRRTKSQAPAKYRPIARCLPSKAKSPSLRRRT